MRCSNFFSLSSTAHLVLVPYQCAMLSNSCNCAVILRLHPRQVLPPPPKVLFFHLPSACLPCFYLSFLVQALRRRSHLRRLASMLESLFVEFECDTQICTLSSSPIPHRIPAIVGSVVSQDASSHAQVSGCHPHPRNSHHAVFLIFACRSDSLHPSFKFVFVVGSR